MNEYKITYNEDRGELDIVELTEEEKQYNKEYAEAYDNCFTHEDYVNRARDIADRMRDL